MPGGGARAAYQVGALKALAEITKAENLGDHPFPILCGTSAGAINAVALASRSEPFPEACVWLESLWKELQCEHVYRSDWSGIMRNTWRLILSLFNAGIAVGRPVAILDNLPLKYLLREKIDFSGIGRNLKSGKLTAVSVTAMNYTEGNSVSFFQGGPVNADWSRWRRQGIPTPLQLRHVMASTAIPTVFPPQRIGRNYYGDGALRQLAPISPALHLGAEKILIISTTGHRKVYETRHKRVHSPAFGQVIGHLLNSAFVDSLETDIERLERINDLIELIPESERKKMKQPMSAVDIEIISPSIDIDALADEYTEQLPKSIRTFLGITGGSSSDGGVNIASYLLFTTDFCDRLIELGYEDTMAKKESLIRFLKL
jgi:NTE family protein